MILIIRHLFHKNYVGLAIWPFIILRESHLKEDAVLLNHERIHLKQQWELLILPFYALYGIEWLLGWFKYGDSRKSYQNISFEREAYRNEFNLNYLSERKVFGFMKYLWGQSSRL